MTTMFSRIIHNIKHRSNVTLRAWSYQFESIVAQRSRRFQQLFTFYHRVYGAHGLKQVLRAYHKQFEPPLRGIMISAVGAVGLSMAQVNAAGFDWAKERLSLKNFDACTRDIEFINSLPRNKLCALCQQRNMKYCYCQIGNKKCTSKTNKEKTKKNCRTNLELQADQMGKALIEGAEENVWEPYFSKNEFSIWRREERTDMYSYKVYARFDDVTAEDLLHVQTDLAYRRQWDDTAITLKTIEDDPVSGTNSHLIYWEMRWPKLFANRDYVFCRRFITDYNSKVMMMVSRGTNHPQYPAFSDKVRVTNYWSYMVIKPFRSFQEPGAHYVLTYYDDPGLAIPQSIKSWVTQKQMPDFLKKMYNATKEYSCKDAVEMNKCMDFISLSLKNDDYNANEARSS